MKAYGEGADAVSRPIAKPAPGTVKVQVGGAAGPFSIGAAGVVTFAIPPPAGAEVRAGFELDVPVRFDSHRIEVALEGCDAGRVVAVPLIEVRV